MVDKVRAVGIVTVAAFLSSAAVSQEAKTSPPQADARDVESIDTIMKAVYEVISGPAGEKRDWDRFRSLFVPEAKLISVFKQQESGEQGYRALSPGDYVEMSGPRLEESGFFEQEVHRVVEQFGPVAHVFSTYESRRRVDDAEPFARGINSFQLMHDAKRWWVVNIFWTSERPDLPIPPRYLP